MSKVSSNPFSNLPKGLSKDDLLKFLKELLEYEKRRICISPILEKFKGERVGDQIEFQETNGTWSYGRIIGFI